MSTQRTHYVTTSDGVAIGGTVHGRGPALVFLQGGIGDGDLDWQGVLGRCTDRFTCHLPSLRGRGLSGDHPDLSVGRAVQDFVAYVDSIGEPAGLVGWSRGANDALGVAAQCDAVTRVVPFEPVAPSAMDEQTQADLGAIVASMAELAAEGRLTAAARTFARWPFNEEEIALADQAGYFEAAGGYTANLLGLLQDLDEHGDPTAGRSVLGAIAAPVAVLYGSHTKPFLAASARHVADVVRNGELREISGVGHAAPLTHPEALAGALTEFFAPARQPA